MAAFLWYFPTILDDDDDDEEDDDEVEDNDKDDDNNDKDISALGLDRDMGFLRGSSSGIPLRS